MFGSLDISGDPFLKLCKNETDCHLSAESASVRIDSAKLQDLGQIRITIEWMNLRTLRVPQSSKI